MSYEFSAGRDSEKDLSQGLAITLASAIAGAAIFATTALPSESVAGAGLVGGLRAAMFASGAMALVRRKRWLKASDLLFVGAGVVAVVAHGPLSRQFLVTFAYALLAVVVDFASGEFGSTRILNAIRASFAALWIIMASRDVLQPVTIETASSGGWFRWQVGWPNPDTAIEHRFVWRDGPVPEGLELRIETVSRCPQETAFSVSAVASPEVNYAELGTMLDNARLVGPNTLAVPVPAHAFAEDGGLTVRIRRTSEDPRCQFIGQRWTGGASGGRDASAIVSADGRFTGTYDLSRNEMREGVILLHLAYAPTTR